MRKRLFLMGGVFILCVSLSGCHLYESLKTTNRVEEGISFGDGVVKMEESAEEENTDNGAVESDMVGQATETEESFVDGVAETEEIIKDNSILMIDDKEGCKLNVKEGWVSIYRYSGSTSACETFEHGESNEIVNCEINLDYFNDASDDKEKFLKRDIEYEISNVVNTDSELKEQEINGNKYYYYTVMTDGIYCISARAILENGLTYSIIYTSSSPSMNLSDIEEFLTCTPIRK